MGFYLDGQYLGAQIHRGIAERGRGGRRDQRRGAGAEAHAVRPHLHGLYTSFAGDVHGESGGAANVDFLVLNEDQYGDFQHGRPSEALFSVQDSHNQAVNFDLPASMDQPVKYYLVFRSSSGESKKTVEANFKVDF